MRAGHFRLLHEYLLQGDIGRRSVATSIATSSGSLSRRFYRQRRLTRPYNAKTSSTAIGQPLSPVEWSADNGVVALKAACVRGNCDILQAVLNAGAATACDTRLVNQRLSEDGLTPLMIVAALGHVGCVEFLLTSGADPRACSMWSDGLTPLHAAARSGHREVVNMLLRAGADVNAKMHCNPQRNMIGGTPIMAAISSNRVECVKLLLQHGADISDTALQLINGAAYKGHIEILSMLLKCQPTALHSAVPELSKKNGLLPLITATLAGHIDCVQLLLDSGADIHATQTNGATALHAAAHKGYDDILALLIDKGANINSQDTQRELTPLIVATCAGRTQCARLLIHRGADISVADGTGYSAIHHAALRGNPDIMVELLAAGANPDTPSENDSGMSPMLLAAREGHEECVRLMMQRGANPMYRSKGSGVTPIHAAAGMGHSVALSHLLSVRASDHTSSSSVAVAQPITSFSAPVAEAAAQAMDVNALTTLPITIGSSDDAECLTPLAAAVRGAVALFTSPHQQSDNYRDNINNNKQNTCKVSAENISTDIDKIDEMFEDYISCIRMLVSSGAAPQTIGEKTAITIETLNVRCSKGNSAYPTTLQQESDVLLSYGSRLKEALLSKEQSSLV